MYCLVVGTALAAAGTVGVASAAPSHTAPAASTAPPAGAHRITTTGATAVSPAGAHRITTAGAKAVSPTGAHRVIPSVGDPAGAVRPSELTAAQRASAVG